MSYTVKNLMRDLRAGKFTSFGCYPTYFVTVDGEPLSHEAIRENLWIVARATRDYAANPRVGSDVKQWAVIGADINWENADLYCAHTNKRIESAYAEPEEAPEETPAIAPDSTALEWAREQGTRTDCPICRRSFTNLAAHMGDHRAVAAQ
jgi:hypothetical protein